MTENERIRRVARHHVEEQIQFADNAEGIETPRRIQRVASAACCVRTPDAGVDGIGDCLSLHVFADDAAPSGHIGVVGLNRGGMSVERRWRDN